MTNHNNDGLFLDSVKSLRYTYDKEANAAYIYLTDISKGAAANTYLCENLPSLVKGDVNLDFDNDGILLGIEVLGADKVLPKQFTQIAD